LAGARRRGSALSVLVLVTDDNAAFLEECLHSVVAQSRRAEEIVLVARGHPRETTRALDRAAAISGRVRRLDVAGSSWAVAVTEGARRAAGDLLLVCDAGDRIAPGSLEAMSRALEREPSTDLVGGTRSELGRLRLRDLMVRRSWWEGSRLEIADGPHGDWSAAAHLVLGGRALPRPEQVAAGPRRGSGEAFGTMPVRAPWAVPWWAAVRVVLDALSADPVRDRFLHWLLDEELAGYLDDTERCTPAQWRELVDASNALLSLSSPGLLSEIRVEAKVRVWLAAHDLRDELEAFCAERWLDDGQFPARTQDGTLYADLPVVADLVPSSMLAIGLPESALHVVLRGMRWVEPGVLELELFAFVPHVSLEVGAWTHQVRLVDADGRRTSLSSTTATSAEVNVASGDRFADHAPGVLLARWDAAGHLAAAAPGDRWELEIDLEVGGVTRRGVLTDADLRGSAGSLTPPGGGVLTLRPRRSSDGSWALVAVEAATEETGWRVTEVVLDGDVVLVSGRAGTGTAWLDLRGSHATSSVEVLVAGSRFESRLRLVHDRWQLGERPLPTGSYRFHLSRPGQPVRRAPMADELASATPCWQRSPTYRLRLQRGLDGAVLVTLAAPLDDDEVGPLAQQRLQRWYATDEHRIDPGSVFLQSYTGQSATDSPLAIHHELRRRRPDLRLIWSVADRSTVVPQGGEGVLLRSREWYAALATSGHIVTNIDMDRWFRKRPGQRLLQSFHGYPAKTMGITAWRGKNFTDLRIERQLRRTSGTWDLLLTPTPAMDEHYRREYRYEGDILAAGYPRDDVLVGPDAPRIREETRRRLGIRDGQQAVLYAPTWRDDLATNFRAAAMSTDFDVEQAAAELGDGYVILLRGHRFHRQRDAADAHILDVTDYPEGNDLVLAADVAVLDYSSLRFHFALTGRPMVFLVPDLDRYTGGVRGFLFDFEGSAPGPLVDTTDGVVAQLRDLDALRERHRDDLVRFNEQFNGHQDGDAAGRAVREFFGPGPGSTG
ncbi:MAG: CDP-glycerol glycerophosphotransferase family protein, partial [Nocardioidaceae bacterium]|nr:CDP-glycerol glycerophosphotransferase family protein [Nocardioidaceae bacterium]